MGKVLSLVVGAVLLVTGIVLLKVWNYEFFFLLRGSIPAILMLVGAVSVVAGIAEFKDTLKKGRQGQ